MRKSINGLAELIKRSFNLDPFASAVFVFCNRNHDRVKILEWDTDGFWMYEPTMVLSGEELSVLLGGVRVELKLKRNEVTERRIS